jgi:D-sedoheptulose 7-phosphate isomerase
MQVEERVRHLFGLSIETKISAADAISKEIATAAERLVQCLLNDGKILVCGNGGSGANAQHFSSNLLNQFEVERPSLPVVALNTDTSTITAVSNIYHYEQVYAKQIQALGQETDVLIVLTTSGNSDSILNALNAANDRGMDTIALTGQGGGVLSNHLGPEDIQISVPSTVPARIREVHLLILNCFCDLIENSLFGQMMG